MLRIISCNIINICKKQLLLQLETEVQHIEWPTTQRRQVWGGMSSSPLSKTGHQVLKTTGRLNARAADLKQKTMAKLGTWTLYSWLNEVPSESLLEDVNATLRTTPTATINETNQLIYTTATYETYNSIRLTTATRSSIFHGEKDLWPRSRQNKGTLANYLQKGVMKCDGLWYTF